ncbi:uncharacterized protein LOC108942331 isoform X2 [Scleropages formosus]|nr:uncharacterized protein LOC108942331 isoform X2 [Scleropages formosus]XP_018621128.1 uncharacterized protein LOC108942331 isoform X2 [Scleropages formosus]
MDLSRNSTRTEEAYSARGCPERRVTGVQSGTTFPPEITFLTVKSCDHCKSLNLSFGFAKRLMDFNKALSAIDERTVKLARILDDSQLSRLSDQMRKSEGIWAKIHDLEALEHRSDDLSLSPAPCDLQVHRSTPKKGSSAIGFFDEGLTLNETGPAHEDLHLNARSKEIGYTTENDSIDFSAEEIPPAAAPGNAWNGDPSLFTHGAEHSKELDSGIQEGESIQPEEGEPEKDAYQAELGPPSGSQSKTSLGSTQGDAEMEKPTAQKRDTVWSRVPMFIRLFVFAAVGFLMLGSLHWCRYRVPRSWVSDSFMGDVLNLCHDPLCNPPI